MASTLVGSFIAVGLLWTALTANRDGVASAPINRPRLAVAEQASTVLAEQSAAVGGQPQGQLSGVDVLASNKVSGPRHPSAPNLTPSAQNRFVFSMARFRISVSYRPACHARWPIEINRRISVLGIRVRINRKTALAAGGRLSRTVGRVRRRCSRRSNLQPQFDCNATARIKTYEHVLADWNATEKRSNLHETYLQTIESNCTC